MIKHYYPKQLANELMRRWPADALPLPVQNQLGHIISVAYQASLLTEEGWPVDCHIIYFPTSAAEDFSGKDNSTFLLNLAVPRD